MKLFPLQTTVYLNCEVHNKVSELQENIQEAMTTSVLSNKMTNTDPPMSSFLSTAVKYME